MSSKKKNKTVSDSEENYNSDDNSKDESHNSNSNNSNEKGDENSNDNNSSDQEQNSSSKNLSKIEKHREDEKNKLALKIKKENESFMKSIEQGKHERLKFLLKQTEIFAHFLIGGKAEEGAKNKKSEKGSKRKNASSSKNNNNNNIELLKDEEEENDLDEIEKEITRLYSQPSILVGGKLTNYQLDGLNWIISLYERGLNGILADEMGLGKTIQSIAFLAYLKQFQKKNGYFLVVVPKSTMPNWSRECKLWCPRMNAIVLNPVKEEREETLAIIAEHKFELVITSYEGVNICINKLKKN